MKLCINTQELKADRARNEISATDLSKAIGLSADGYRKKERGDTEFKPSEIYAIAKALDLTLDRVNVIFFAGKLPRG